MLSKNEGVRRLALVAGAAVALAVFAMAMTGRAQIPTAALGAACYGVAAWLSVHAVAWIIEGFKKPANKP